MNNLNPLVGEIHFRHWQNARVLGDPRSLRGHIQPVGGEARVSRLFHPIQRIPIAASIEKCGGGCFADPPQPRLFRGQRSVDSRTDSFGQSSGWPDNRGGHPAGPPLSRRGRDPWKGRDTFYLVGSQSAHLRRLADVQYVTYSFRSSHLEKLTPRNLVNPH